jgi:DNA-directed RNA polymerase specialized sigma24 family protein
VSNRSARRHAGPLLAFIRHLVGNPHRSEELFQEVFLAVWVKRTQYEQDGRFARGCTPSP